MTAHLSSRHLPNRSLRAGMYLIQLSALPGYCVRGRRRQPPLSTPACGSGVATAGAEDSLDRVFECKTLAEVGSKDGLGGLYAREAVGFGKAVVSAPIYNSLVVTDEPIEGLSIFGDRAQRRWQEEHQQLPDPLKELLVGEDRWDVRLTIWLLWLSQQGCPRWRRYTHSLPRVEEMSLLLNFSAEERAELQLPELVEEAETQRDWAHTVHNTYRGLIKELGLRGALDDTLWAMAMVRSRTFGESVDGENITLMMPFADMANHSSDYAASFAISSNREEFQIVSYKPLAAGEEVCITYGEEKSNEELIRDYGFVLKGNVNDRVRLALPPQVQVQLSGPDLLRCFNMKGSITTLEGSDSAGGMRLQIACPDNADVDARRLISVLSSLPVFDGTPGSNRPAPRHSAPAAEHGSGRMSGFNPTNLSWSGLLSSSSRIPWPWSPTAASGPAPGVRAAANPVRQAVASSDATANERRSVHALTTLCRDAQQAFPTSAAHDMQLINAGCRQPVEKSASTPGGSAPDAEQPDLTTARSPTPAPLRLNPRIMTAVRCRLEHKLLLARAVRTLDQYAGMLDRRVALPSS